MRCPDLVGICESARTDGLDAWRGAAGRDAGARRAALCVRPMWLDVARADRLCLLLIVNA